MTRIALVWLIAVGLPAVAGAQPKAFEGCAGCHGPKGEVKGFPRIAGQPAPYLHRQLEAYSDGRRQNEIMTNAAKSLTPQQRAEVAEYFAALVLPPAKTSTAERRVPGDVLARGRVLSTRGDEDRRVPACQNCHGPTGTGRGPYGAYLAGQDGKYLEGTLLEWKAGKRDTDPSGAMATITKNLSPADIAAVAAYYAALPVHVAQRPPEERSKKPPVSRPVPTKPGAADRQPQGTGATGGATTGGTQGPGGSAPQPDAPSP